MSRIPNLLTIDWLHKKYKENLISPQDVMDEIIIRTKRDESLNIWIIAPTKESLRKSIENLPVFDLEKYPLWGIPFAVKDNINVKGFKTTAGCPDFAYLAEEDAVVIERLIGAGGIMIGKSNLDQFATGLVGTRSPYGETCNALNVELISGGSSSGSAVAVARGQAVFSLGTDTAGSGRVPAALNNLFGWKPSLGRWPTKGVVPACASLDCVSVFTNSMKECIVIDDVLRGICPLDPWSKESNKISHRLPKKILLPDKQPEFFGKYKTAYEFQWNTIVKKIENMGIEVEKIDYSIFDTASRILYDGPYIAERWSDLGEFVESNPGSTLKVTEKILSAGKNLNASELFTAKHKLQSIKSEVKQMLQESVLIMPTVGGTFLRSEVRKDPIALNSSLGKYTNHCNLLDLCACNIPTMLEDIPFGITVFALKGNEGLIVSTAEEFANEKILVAVCGLHMRGFPLESQMLEHGAAFIREAYTAPKYRFVRIETGIPKPGLIKCLSGGSSIKVELWEMPIKQVGHFLTLIPSPLGLGKLELEDNSLVIGFICEGYVADISTDITGFGSWEKSIQI
ncbi:MAG: amidase family protein [Clostridiales bacterium]